MPFIEVETQSTRPWVLVCHYATPEQGGARQRQEVHRCTDEDEAKRIARQRAAMDDCYLIELMVDAGCLHAVG